jgi:potassium channel subfamily K
MDVLGNDDASPNGNVVEEGAGSGGEEREIRGPPERRTGLQQWKDEGQEQGRGLDWLHGKNPLNVSETLTEWMLLTLVEKLEGELYELRKELGNTAEVE